MTHLPSRRRLLQGASMAGLGRLAAGPLAGARFVRGPQVAGTLVAGSLSAASSGAHAQAAPAVRPAPAPPAPTRAATSPPLRTVAEGLERPWGLAFLPDGRMLVTERPGRLRLVTPAGQVSPPLAGLPAVAASGQGGLLDVALSPTFERDRTVFLSCAQPTSGGARTAVLRAELGDQGLRDVRTIFTQAQDASGGLHFGSRLAFARDGNLFVTMGDRYQRMQQAQDLSTHFGKVVRIRPDGSVPPDNPFVGRAGALPEIWSYGHRNVQGAAIHPVTGKLWTHEHGARGGDEVNVDEAGRNYGWPVITWGIDYSGATIGEGQIKPGLEQPVHYWVPSIAPCGMAFCTSERYPGWRGSVLVGSLVFQMVARLTLDGERVTGEERLAFDVGQRVRDVRQGPDGWLYLLTDAANGRLMRIG